MAGAVFSLAGGEVRGLVPAGPILSRVDGQGKMVAHRAETAIAHNRAAVVPSDLYYLRTETNRRVVLLDMHSHVAAGNEIAVIRTEGDEENHSVFIRGPLDLKRCQMPRQMDCRRRGFEKNGDFLFFEHESLLGWFIFLESTLFPCVSQKCFLYSLFGTPCLASNCFDI
jgi:hypothetical protein